MLNKSNTATKCSSNLNSVDEIIAKLIPSELENVQLPSPELLNFYNNLKDRTLWLDTEVDVNWIEYSKYILQWNKEDYGIEHASRKPIKLFFFSYGGDLDVNNLFIDIIKQSKTPVYGVNMGQACSAGCFIYLACHKRYAMPNSRFLLHKGSADNISGTFEQICAFVEEYQKKIENLVKYLKETTKIPDDMLMERLMSEWYISAQEAVEFNMCDKIITDLDEIL